VNLSTFYNIYYKHRFYKANTILKFYLFFAILTRFFHNYLFNNKKINLDNLAVKNKDLLSKDLNYLFEYFNSDKGSFFKDQYHKNKQNKKINGHQYSSFYENYFHNLKDKKLEILEIGSFKGGAIAAFFFYFKNSLIYSADLYPDLFLFKSNRVKNYLIDSSSEFSILTLKSKLPRLDIIIDDAGHYFKDQIITLFSLFGALNRGGCFIVEELDFPDTRKDMNILNEAPTLKSILYFAKNGIDFNSKYITHEQKKYFLDNFESINIFKGIFNEIAFIKKK
jgi:hypothetical protein